MGLADLAAHTTNQRTRTVRSDGSGALSPLQKYAPGQIQLSQDVLDSFAENQRRAARLQSMGDPYADDNYLRSIKNFGLGIIGGAVKLSGLESVLTFLDRARKTIHLGILDVANVDDAMVDRGETENKINWSDYANLLLGHNTDVEKRLGTELVGEGANLSGSLLLDRTGIWKEDSLPIISAFSDWKFGDSWVDRYLFKPLASTSRFALALGTDVFTDPVTLATGGLAGLGRKMARGAVVSEVERSAVNVFNTLSKVEGRVAAEKAIATARVPFKPTGIVQKLREGSEVTTRSLSTLERKMAMDTIERTESLVKSGANWSDAFQRALGLDPEVALGYLDDTGKLKNTLLKDPRENPATGTWGVTPGSVASDAINETVNVIEHKAFHSDNSWWQTYATHVEETAPQLNWTLGGFRLGFMRTTLKDFPSTRGIISGAKSRVGETAAATAVKEMQSFKNSYAFLQLKVRPFLSRDAIDIAVLRQNDPLLQDTKFLQKATGVLDKEFAGQPVSTYASLLNVSRAGDRALRYSQVENSAVQIEAGMGKLAREIGKEIPDELTQLEVMRRAVAAVNDNAIPNFEGLDVSDAVRAKTLGFVETATKEYDFLKEQVMRMDPQLAEEFGGGLRAHRPFQVNDAYRKLVTHVLETKTKISWPRTPEEVKSFIARIKEAANDVPGIDLLDENTVDTFIKFITQFGNEDTVIKAFGETEALRMRRTGRGTFGILHEGDVEYQTAFTAHSDLNDMLSAATQGWLKTVNAEHDRFLGQWRRSVGKTASRADALDVLTMDPVEMMNQYTNQLRTKIVEQAMIGEAQRFGLVKQSKKWIDQALLIDRVSTGGPASIRKQLNELVKQDSQIAAGDAIDRAVAQSFAQAIDIDMGNGRVIRQVLPVVAEGEGFKRAVEGMKRSLEILDGVTKEFPGEYDRQVRKLVAQGEPRASAELRVLQQYADMVEEQRAQFVLEVSGDFQKTAREVLDLYTMSDRAPNQVMDDMASTMRQLEDSANEAFDQYRRQFTEAAGTPAVGPRAINVTQSVDLERALRGIGERRLELTSKALDDRLTQVGKEIARAVENGDATEAMLKAERRVYQVMKRATDAMQEGRPFEVDALPMEVIDTPRVVQGVKGAPGSSLQPEIFSAIDQADVTFVFYDPVMNVDEIMYYINYAMTGKQKKMNVAELNGFIPLSSDGALSVPRFGVENKHRVVLIKKPTEVADPQWMESLSALLQRRTENLGRTPRVAVVAPASFEAPAVYIPGRSAVRDVWSVARSIAKDRKIDDFDSIAAIHSIIVEANRDKVVALRRKGQGVRAGALFLDETGARHGLLAEKYADPGIQKAILGELYVEPQTLQYLDDVLHNYLRDHPEIRTREVLPEDLVAVVEDSLYVPSQARLSDLEKLPGKKLNELIDEWDLPKSLKRRPVAERRAALFDARVELDAPTNISVPSNAFFNDVAGYWRSRVEGSKSWDPTTWAQLLDEGFTGFSQMRTKQIMDETFSTLSPEGWGPKARPLGVVKPEDRADEVARATAQVKYQEYIEAAIRHHAPLEDAAAEAAWLEQTKAKASELYDTIFKEAKTEIIREDKPLIETASSLWARHLAEQTNEEIRHANSLEKAAARKEGREPVLRKEVLLPERKFTKSRERRLRNTPFEASEVERFGRSGKMIFAEDAEQVWVIPPQTPIIVPGAALEVKLQEAGFKEAKAGTQKELSRGKATVQTAAEKAEIRARKARREYLKSLPEDARKTKAAKVEAEKVYDDTFKQEYSIERTAAEFESTAEPEVAVAGAQAGPAPTKAAKDLTMEETIAAYERGRAALEAPDLNTPTGGRLLTEGQREYDPVTQTWFTVKGPRAGAGRQISMSPDLMEQWIQDVLAAPRRVESDIIRSYHQGIVTDFLIPTFKQLIDELSDVRNGAIREAATAAGIDVKTALDLWDRIMVTSDLTLIDQHPELRNLLGYLVALEDRVQRGGSIERAAREAIGAEDAAAQELRQSFLPPKPEEVAPVTVPPKPTKPRFPENLSDINDFDMQGLSIEEQAARFGMDPESYLSYRSDLFDEWDRDWAQWEQAKAAYDSAMERSLQVEAAPRIVKPPPEAGELYHFTKKGVPSDAINVGRSTSGGYKDGLFGNPFRVQRGESTHRAVFEYRKYLEERIRNDPEFRAEVANLYGKKIVCPTTAHAPCHGEVLLEWANRLHYGDLPSGAVPDPGPIMGQAGQVVNVSPLAATHAADAISQRLALWNEYARQQTDVHMRNLYDIALHMDPQGGVHDLARLTQDVLSAQPGTPQAEAATAALERLWKDQRETIERQAQSVWGPDATLHPIHTDKGVQFIVELPGSDTTAITARGRTFDELVDDLRAGQITAEELQTDGLDMVVFAANLRNRIEQSVARNPEPATRTMALQGVAGLASARLYSQLGDLTVEVMNAVQEAVSSGSATKLRNLVMTTGPEGELVSSKTWQVLGEYLSKSSPGDWQRLRRYVQAGLLADAEGFGDPQAFARFWQNERAVHGALTWNMGEIQRRVQQEAMTAAESAKLTAIQAHELAFHYKQLLELVTGLDKWDVSLRPDTGVLGKQQAAKIGQAVERLDRGPSLGARLRRAKEEVGTQLNDPNRKAYYTAANAKFGTVTDELVAINAHLEMLTSPFSPLRKLIEGDNPAMSPTAGKSVIEKARSIQEQLQQALSPRGSDSISVYAGPEPGFIRTNQATGTGLLAGLDVDPILSALVDMQLNNLKALYTPYGLKMMQGGLKALQQLWKRWATISRPSFHLRNLVGGVANNLLIGVAPWHYAEWAPSVMKYRSIERALAGGSDHVYNELIQVGKDTSSINLLEDVILPQLPAKHRSAFREAHYNGVLQTSFSRGDLGIVPGQARQWTRPQDPNFGVYVAGGEVMETFEDVLRMTAFGRWFDETIPGISGRFATTLVEGVHFNYADLTQFERKIKTVIPFWVWTRQNIPLQLNQLAHHPGSMLAWENARKNWNEEFDERNSPFARWQRTQGWVLPYQRGQGDNSARLVWSPQLPYLDIENFPLLPDEKAQGVIPAPNVFDVQAWFQFAADSVGPQWSVPKRLLEDEGSAGSLPTGFNEIAKIVDVLLPSRFPRDAQGNVYASKWISSLAGSAFPFANEYRAALGILPANQYRRVNEGWQPGESPNPLERLQSGVMQTVGKGLGFKYSTPQDFFFDVYDTSQELSTMEREYRTGITR